MAIQVTITPPQLEGGETHSKTHITLYRDSGLTDIEYSGEFTDKHLLNMTINRELTAGHDYYLTGRFEFNPGGLQGVSAPVRINPSNTKDSIVYLYPPTNNKAIDPIIFNKIYPPGEFVLPGLDLTNIKDMVESVTWLIEDLSGNVRFISPNNAIQNKTILVDTMLPPDDIYLLRVSGKFSYNNSTLLNCQQFEVGGFEKNGFKVINEKGCKGDSPTLVTNKPINFKQNRIRVFEHGTDVLLKDFITNEEINLKSVNINDLTYYVEITCELTNGDMVGPIFHYVNLTGIKSLPYCIPYALG